MTDLESIAEMFLGRQPSKLTPLERQVYFFLESKGLLTEEHNWTGKTLIVKPIKDDNDPYYYDGKHGYFGNR